MLTFSDLQNTVIKVLMEGRKLGTLLQSGFQTVAYCRVERVLWRLKNGLLKHELLIEKTTPFGSRTLCNKWTGVVELIFAGSWSIVMMMKKMSCLYFYYGKQPCMFCILKKQFQMAFRTSNCTKKLCADECKNVSLDLPVTVLARKEARKQLANDRLISVKNKNYI